MKKLLANFALCTQTDTFSDDVQPTPCCRPIATWPQSPEALENDSQGLTTEHVRFSALSLINGRWVFLCLLCRMMEQSVEARSLIQLIKCCPRHQLEGKEKNCSDKRNIAVEQHQHHSVLVLTAMTTHERASSTKVSKT